MKAVTLGLCRCTCNGFLKLCPIGLLLPHAQPRCSTVFRHWNQLEPLPNLVRGGEEPYLKAGAARRVEFFEGFKAQIMAEDTKRKTSPGEFVRQVRSETGKVVWPTREETIRTAIFVFIMMVVLSLFFLGVDTVFSAVVRFLMTLA